MYFKDLKINFSATLKDLFFPRFCVGCKTPGTLLCEPCFHEVELYQNFHCAFCQQQLTANDHGGALCHDCCGSLSLDALYIGVSYEDETVKKSIHALKYEFLEELAQPAAVWAEAGMRRFAPSLDGHVFVPIPLHRRRKYARGFNQSAMIAKILSAGFQSAYDEEILQRTRFTNFQAELGREERFKNVRSAFRAAYGRSVPKKIILVDDVSTTGATLSACADLLKKNGAEYVGACVSAHGKL